MDIDHARKSIELLSACIEQRHMHEYCEVFMLLRGSGRADIGCNVERLETGSVLVINSLEQHSLSISENSTAIRVSIPYRLIMSVLPLRFLCLPSYENDVNKPHYDHLRGVIANAALSSLENDRHEIVSNYFLYSVLYELFRNFAQIGSEEPDPGLLSRRFLAYIYKHYSEPITSRSASEHFFLSQSYFSRIFTERIGMSFTSCLKRVRLENAREDLIASDDTMTAIAEKNGFTSQKAFGMTFQRAYGISPSHFRGSSRERTDAAPLEVAATPTEDAGLKELLGAFTRAASIHTSAGAVRVMVPVEVSLVKKGAPMRQTWRNMLCVGRASDVLNADIMAQISDMQQEMGFSYLHFHGLFDDDMRIYAENFRGEPELNFHFLDRIFDFLSDIGIKPFIELGFMPSLLASDPEERTFADGYHSKPKSLRKWSYLLFSFIKHCVLRYKYEEVQSWKFQIWDSACYDFWWQGTPEEFYEFYKASYHAIKSAYPEICIGSPSVSIYIVENSNWLDRFLQYTRENNCEPDFISLAAYPHDEYPLFEIDSETQMLVVKPENRQARFSVDELPKHYPISLNRNYLRDGIALVEQKLKANEFELPIYITQWNSSHVSSPLNDLTYKAAYVLKNICENFDAAESFGYWIMSDAKEEYTAHDLPFHGSGGLISNIGIKKPAYNAYAFLAKLRGSVLAQGDGYFVARDGDDVFVVMYNYIHPCNEYCRRPESYVGFDDIFPDAFTKNLQLNIKGFSKGTYRINRYLLNRESGSSYDNWLRLGALDCLNAEDIAYLKYTSIPQQTSLVKEIKSVYTISALLKPHEIRLYELIKS